MFMFVMCLAGLLIVLLSLGLFVAFVTAVARWVWTGDSDYGRLPLVMAVSGVVLLVIMVGALVSIVSQLS